jgi:hypothetical protein
LLRRALAALQFGLVGCAILGVGRRDIDRVWRARLAPAQRETDKGRQAFAGSPAKQQENLVNLGALGQGGGKLGKNPDRSDRQVSFHRQVRTRGSQSIHKRRG